jgi:hypothetical protein
MRTFVNWITKKISSLVGTVHLKSIYEETTRIRELYEGIALEKYLQENLFTNEAYVNSKKITHFHKSVFTQNGEDGLIDEIFRRIGVIDNYFVEFGVHGIKNNSTYLLVKGWKGLWIGGSEMGGKIIPGKFNDLMKSGRLDFSRNWITRENIEGIFDEKRVPKKFDFLSIDLDGNDYWIWKAIQNYSPRVVCIEYNATFPPDILWVMSYDPNHIWDQTNYFGASLKALEKLGKEKGYVLVGCDFAGCNVFFIRNDQNLALFETPFTSEHHYEPPRYFLSKSSGHIQGFGPFEASL